MRQQLYVKKKYFLHHDRLLICCDDQVLEDANIKEAARAIVFGALANSGQVRMSEKNSGLKRPHTHRD